VATHELIRERGGTAEYVETDVSDPDDVESVVAAARELGGVDVMVNNAALFAGGGIRELDVDDFDAMLRVNARGVMLGTQVAANDMLDRDEPGCIVNTASISSTYAQFGQVGYDATKGRGQDAHPRRCPRPGRDGHPGQRRRTRADRDRISRRVDRRGSGVRRLRRVPEGHSDGAGGDAGGRRAGHLLPRERRRRLHHRWLLHVDGGWHVC